MAAMVPITGATPTPVYLAAVAEPLSQQMGASAPQRVISQTQESVVFLCNATDRFEGPNGFDFRVKANVDLYSGRQCKVTKCIVPKLPNINVKNNTFIIKHENGTTGTIRLTPSFYNQSSIVNELKAKIDAAFALFGVPDTVAVSFNTSTKIVSITSNGGYRWFFVDTSDFIVRGGSMLGFRGLPLATAATSGSITNFSSSVGFIYSRYIVIKSRRLNEDIRSVSRTSNNEADIVAAVSLVNDYNSSDFDTTGAFVGSLISEKVTYDAPTLNILNRNKNLNYVDFQIVDEFGFNLADVLLFDEAPTQVSTFECVIWLLIDL